MIKPHIPSVILLLAMMISAVTSSYAQSAGYRFHCEGDTAAINKIIRELQTIGPSERARTLAAAEVLVGADYSSTAKEDKTESPIYISVHSMDEMELVENALALAKASKRTNASWTDFVCELENIRYRRGENNGFTSRLRYSSDWIADNTYRGNLKEYTHSLPSPASTSRTLDKITRSKEEYPALADSVTFEKMKMLEMGYCMHKITYMKRESMGKKNVVELLKEGDIIIIIPRDTETDLLDAGVLKFVDGTPHLIHSSARTGKVELMPITLNEYMRLNAKSMTGYRILRVEN